MIVLSRVLHVPCDITMAFLAFKPAFVGKREITSCLAKAYLCSAKDVSTDTLKLPPKKQRRTYNKTPVNNNLSWEERLADVVTPLWRLRYDEQLNLKQKRMERIVSKLNDQLSMGISSQLQSSHRNNAYFPVLPILPSPVRDGYRNKSTFSVNIGVDGNPKTVGFYVGTCRQNNITCVNGDHLLNMPDKHKLVARCYQDFLRMSPLESCLFFHTGHWREVTVRTNAEGKTMAIVFFHPQTLSAAEMAVHKTALVDYFTRGAGEVCQLDSLYFQESSMTRCSHEDSPYQLLFGQPHIHEEVLGYKFRISADAFFQVNQAAAEVLYSTVRDMCFPNSEVEGGYTKLGGTLLDVCCGTGAIGITMSPRVERVIGIELIEQAVEDARHNAAFNGVVNCEFLPGKAEVILPGLMPQLSPSKEQLTVVVNPARAGLHYRVVRALRNEHAIRRLVYISCKPEGEAMRNFKELCCLPDPNKKLTGEPFSLSMAVPVDMFPHTPHCELVLLFER